MQSAEKENGERERERELLEKGCEREKRAGERNLKR